MIAFLIVSTMIPVNDVKAEDTDYFSTEYTYKVRIYAGGQGTFPDGKDVVVEQVKAGESIDVRDLIDNMIMNPAIDAAGNKVENKYYAKGIRESGKDNNTVAGTVFKITRDVDFVVAYAMRGGDVAYTVKYVLEATGEELFPSETFYGNAGDKAVAAYRYVDGYVPQAYNLAMTLRPDQDNVFTFYYKSGKNAGYYYETDGGTKYLYKDGETVIEHIPGKIIHIAGPVVDTTDNSNEHQNPAVTVVEDEPLVRENPANVNRQADSKNVEERNPIEASDMPETYIDLDEEAVALADGNKWLKDFFEDGDVIIGKIPVLAFTGIAIVAGVVLAVYLLTHSKNKKETEDKNHEEK